VLKTRFGGSSWHGGDTGKVRYAPDIGSFSPAGGKYWGKPGKIFKFPASWHNGWPNCHLETVLF